MNQVQQEHVWPPGPKGYPLFGSIWDLRRDLLGWLEKCAARYGDFVPIRLGLRQGFLVCDLEAIADVLDRQHSHFRKVHLLTNNRLFLGYGLLTSEGDRAAYQRRLVQPMFHTERMALYTGIIVEEARRVAECWRDGCVRDMQEEMARLTLTILLRCLFGVEAGIRDADVERIAQAVNIAQEHMKARYASIFSFPDTLLTIGNLGLRRTIKALDQIIYRMIAVRRKSCATGSDLLSILICARDGDGRHMSDKEIRDEAVTMLFAGHETTALTLSWTWYLLSQNPGAAARMRAELLAAVPSDMATTGDLPRLKSVERVIKEAQRLYPPVYAYGRDAVVDTVVGQYSIPSGASVIIAPWVLHRQARFFPDPLQFCPNRWTAEFEGSLPRLAYCPFGGGVRQCIGKGFAMLESVLILATLARNYDLRLVSTKQLELWPAFTLRSRYGLPMAVNYVTQ